MPNRSDVERVERDLLARSGALLSGDIGTFDDVFEHDRPRGRPTRAGHARRSAQLIVRRIVGHAPLNGLGASSRFAGFADSLATTLAELESGLVEPARSTATSDVSTPPTARSSTGSACGTATRCGGTPPIAWLSRSSRRGTASPSSPTGSRT